MSSAFLNILRQKFGVKIFAIVTLFIIIISFSFTVFFFQHQSRLLTDALVQNNRLLADILAYNARIGVFSENEELLRNPMDALFQQEETVEVSIYNLGGRLLTRRARTGIGEVHTPGRPGADDGRMDPALAEKLRAEPSSFYRDDRHAMEFWAPVFARHPYREAESLLVGDTSRPAGKSITGFVRITVGKAALDKKLGTLLLQSILIGMVFLMVGSGIIYLIVKRMVSPLNTLIAGVRRLGKGDFNERVPVETGDEIGNLAMAFNQMSESLMRREVEKKLLEEQLSHSQRMEAIGTLAGGIAHDFNNILGAISGYTELAMAKVPRESKISQYLSQIYMSSRRAVDLVRQILEFSRETETDLRPIGISSLVKETFKMMRATIPTSIEIRQNIRAEQDTVMGDPTQIHQIIMNLCTNAYQAIGDKPGEIEVTLETTEINEDSALMVHGLAPGAYIRLTVRDSGTGIEPAIMDRIFDPFFTTKKTGEGTGLGLSVVHGIVKNYGGEITVESRTGEGSAFHVFLPLVSGTQGEAAGEDAAPAIGGSERILLVDDEEFLVTMTREMLQDLGYSVVAITDSGEALEVFRSDPEEFDLLITDQTMPKLSGTDLAREVILIRPDIPIILCTGFSRSINAEQAQAMGIREFIMKPITKYQISRAIRRVLAVTHAGRSFSVHCAL